MTGGHDNAMTEIALALAMGFFSVMVLTMVSMGAGGPGEPANASVAARLAPAADDAPEAATVRPQAEDRVIFLHRGRFYDDGLKPVDPARLTDDGGRVILAFDPRTPVAEALAARARIPLADLTVTAMDARWQAALEQQLD